MITTSTNPYFDDFDESKKFQRILFRPGYAVQARELTQAQTIIQAQVERFGKHIFDEGSLVTGGQFDIDTTVPYVVLNPTIPGTNTTISLDVFEGKIIQGAITGVQAIVLKTGNHILYPETGLSVPVLFVRYTSGGQTTDQFGQTVYHSQFISENIQTVVGEFESSDLASVSSDPLALGKGSLFSIQEGTVFTNGFFANFGKQSVVIDAFSQFPTCRVGFIITRSIVSSDDDETLLDNAQGSFNYAAPGADRLKIDPVLTRIEIDDTAALPEFVELFIVKDGVVQRLEERSQYAIIGDEIAKRTFDESGDYVVRGMDIVIREHLDTGFNEGYKKLADGGDSKSLAIGVGPGLAYVKGYEINTLVTNYVSVPKSSDTVDVPSQVVTPRIGNYILVKETIGTLILDKGTLVTFYDTAQTRLSNRSNDIDVLPIGDRIGTARIKAVVKDSGVLGTPEAVIAIYIFDLQLEQGKTFANARSVFCSSPVFFGDIVLTAGSASLRDTKNSTAIFPLGSKYIHKVRRHDLDTDEYDVNMTYVRQFTKTNINVNSSGVADSVTELGVNETFNYGATTETGLSSREKNTILFSLNETAYVALTGTVTGTQGQTTLSGSSTLFLLLNPGDKIRLLTDTYQAAYPRVLTVVSALSNTSLIIKDPTSQGGILTQNVDAGSIVQKVYFKGDFIDLNTNGSSVANSYSEGRLVTIDQTSKSMIINLYENFVDSAGNPATVSANVSYLVDRNNTKEAAKKLVSGVYVKINCATYTGNLKQKINLGFSDVFRLKEVRRATKKSGQNPDPFADGTEGSNVTNLFVFDNGQRDDFYDYATILPTSSITLTTDDWLLVKLDVFEPSITEGQGYFSIDSYPVNDDLVSDTTIFTHEIPEYLSKITGYVYDLRNCLDFRPIKTNVVAKASDYVTVANAIINPNPLSAFLESGGLRLPDPTENIETDYSYYLARRDVVVVDKNGNFSVVKGISNINPVTPTISENVMGVAKVFVPPYPSLSLSYARILGKESLACKIDMITFSRHTMRDIGILKERIANLEYYNSVNMLEKTATDMLVLDEDGNNRFKNGFFVDGFVDHSLGDTINADYKIVVDNKETVIRPLYTMDSMLYGLDPNRPSTNIVHMSEGVMLPFSETTLLEQLKATSYRNIEQSVFRYIGELTLIPDTDSWIDSSTVDKKVDFDLSSNYPTSVLEGTWGAWQSVVTGYNLYDRRVNDRSGDVSKSPKFYGTFATYAEALAYATKYDRDGRFYIETVGQETRSKTDLVPANKTDTQNLGSFVTDVSLATYIRPCIIVLYASGLKANTRFYVYFDDENMDDYVSPIPTGITKIGTWDDIDYYKAVLSGPPPYKAVPIQLEGNPLISDNYGEVLALLRLPATGKRFRVGSRSVKITDSPTNAVDATSFCENYFVGQGLTVKKQNTILSIKSTVLLPVVKKDSRPTSKVDIYGPSCMAYSFYVKAPEGDDGLFLTSVDVWIRSIDTTNKLGVWFELREMSSDGGITRTTVPYSKVFMKWNDSRIKIYNPIDSTAALNPENYKTRVNFECPVFLMNDTQYAFVIHTEGLNPNTYFWVSRLGEKDVVSGAQVNARQLTGNVYTTNNNLNWDIVPDLDLKIRFNRAKFTPNVPGVLRLGNIPYEFFDIGDTSQFFSVVGEEIDQSQVLVLNVTSGTVALGDVIRTSTETAGATVVAISGGNYYTTGFNFQAGQSFTIVDKATVGTVTSINTSLAAVGILMKHDLRYNTLQLSKSNGKFVVGCKIKGYRSGSVATINAINNKPYSTTNFNPNYLEFANTSCRFDIKGVSQSTNQFTKPISVIPNSDFHFDEALIVASRSNEVSNFNEQSTLQADITLNTISEWVSPIVDMARTNSVIVTNWINDDILGEDEPAGGNLLNKYISKIVTLAEGQDAEDLLVALTAYVPPGTTSKYPVKVWMKIWNKEDTGSLFQDKNWIEMVGREGILYSSLSNKDDFKSFNFKIPSSMMLGSVGEVQYSNQGDVWKPEVSVEVNQILYVIDDNFEPGSPRYRHYKVTTAGITGTSSPTHVKGNLANGTAVLTAQYEAFGDLWSSKIGQEVVEGQILHVANDDGGYRHYQVTTAGVLDGGPPTFIKPSENPDDVYGSVYVDAYLPVNGNLYNGFKQFAVKIGLLGTNSAIVPRVGDLRVIALQM